MARRIGVSPARYHQWENGTRPPPEALAEAISRLGLSEEAELLAYLLDPFETAAPPSWWSASGPVPLAGQPRDPRWTSEPARPGDAPRLSRATEEALRAEALDAAREAAEGIVADHALSRAETDARLAAKVAGVRPRSPVTAPAPPASLPWGRLAALLARGLAAREAHNQAEEAATVAELRGLVCAVPA